MTAQRTQSSVRPRRRLAVTITVVILALLLFGFVIFAGVYADVLWYRQLGYLGVLLTQWGARIITFLVGFVAMALPIWVSIQVAYRARPVYAKLNTNLDRYREVFEPLRRLAMYGIPVIMGIFAGVSTASRWDISYQWLNSTDFGKTDPQFHLDISFFVFQLPFYRGAVGFASAVVLLAGLLVVATNYLYGAIRVSGRELVVSKSARVQIAVTAGIYVALQAISVWLDQYATVSADGSLITGASYTDVHAVIPGQQILSAVALAVAILFFVTAVIGRWRLPIIGTALLLVSSLVIGVIYPWVVQRFQVDPSARSVESPYIKRNIDLTRDAYNVSDVEVIPFAAKTDAEPGALRADAETTASIRLMDPSVISPTIQQIEQYRQYYQFPTNLNVDRYTIDGKTQDTVVAVRDLNLQALGDAGTWYNSHIVYTHGYGLVAAAGNKRSSDGQPVLVESGIPQAGKLGNFEPRVYFGTNSPRYSIVGAPEGTKPVELDYPSSGQGADRTENTFMGDGGPKLDNPITKLIYALKFQSEQIFFSDAVNTESQILYDRDPIQRVQKVAPYLTLDSETYPTVVDGRIVWVVDAYTTSNQYPYSHRISLSSAIADSEESAPSLAFDDVNYMRNSVKATVDAYSGKVTLYAWDTKDPVLATWQKIFPSTVKSVSDMSADLMSHVRYPADLFKVQRSILGRYHVTDSGQFYSREDAWATPKEPTAEANSSLLQPPYYLTMQLPGQKTPAFSLYSTYIPEAEAGNSRNVLRGFLAVNSDAGKDAGKPSADFGKLRLLELPADDNVPGPGQVQANFNSNATVSQQLNLLKQGQSQVINGNLLTVPVGGGLLYVQPVYVKSTGNTSYPLLQKVLAAFGDKIAFEDTLDQALNDLFGGNSGAAAGDESVSPSGGTPNTGGVAPNTGGAPSPGTGEPAQPTQETIQSLLAQAQQALQTKKDAMAKGDWTAYGAADAQLNSIISQLVALEGGSGTQGSK